MHVPTMAEMMAENKAPEILFWVGCAGSFDQRAQKLQKLLQQYLTRLALAMQYWEKKKCVRGILLVVREMNLCSR